MDTWNRMRAARAQGGCGTGRKKVKGLVKEHRRMAQGHRQQCGDTDNCGEGPREGMGGGKHGGRRKWGHL